MAEYIALVPLLPFIGFLILSFFGSKLKNEKIIGTIGSATVGISFLIVIIVFLDLLKTHPEAPIIVPIYQWIHAGNFSIDVSYQIDQLSVLFSLVITGVGFLIHLYSIGYMHGDRSFSRFFAYLNLFIFMMLNLVLASNFLLTFLGWEGVGLCSYLLIGFWYDRKFVGTRITWTGDAANKAFIVNRIGDFGFIIAMFLILTTFGSLDYSTVMSSAAVGYNSYLGTGIITSITLLLFLGCTGKSAQIPLAVWLPDAMAGPTPVSALIHAATMVTAGIFLVARTSVLFSLAPTSMMIMAIVGTATAFFAATVGLVQNDIKKVLAYSTVSQLGFMFAALGVGAFSAGVFHVVTHAFFKGLLFLAAGAVIHGMHDEQNIKRMGGLSKYMPTTYKTFFAATLAISGIPFFAGFFSKDEILWSMFNSGNISLWIILTLSAFCTAFYMFRLLYLVFRGSERFDMKHIHPHESPKTMTIPLTILAVLSVFGGFLGVPAVLGSWATEHSSWIENWLEPIFKPSSDILALRMGASHATHLTEIIFMLISVVVAITGIYLARKYYYKDENWTVPRKLTKNLRPIYLMLLKKYKLDEIYFNMIIDPLINFSKSVLWIGFDNHFIDRIVNGTARQTVKMGEGIRRLQWGVVQSYAALMMLGILIILVVMLLV